MTTHRTDPVPHPECSRSDRRGRRLRLFFTLVSRTSEDSGLWPLTARPLGGDRHGGARGRRRPPGAANRPGAGLAVLTGLLDSTANVFFLFASREGFADARRGDRRDVPGVDGGARPNRAGRTTGAPPVRRTGPGRRRGHDDRRRLNRPIADLNLRRPMRSAEATGERSTGAPTGTYATSCRGGAPRQLSLRQRAIRPRPRRSCPIAVHHVSRFVDGLGELLDRRLCQRRGRSR